MNRHSELLDNPGILDALEARASSSGRTRPPAEENGTSAPITASQAYSSEQQGGNLTGTQIRATRLRQFSNPALDGNPVVAVAEALGNQQR